VSSLTAIDITIALMLHFLQYHTRTEVRIVFTFHLKQSLERIHVVFLEGGNRAMQIALFCGNQVQTDNSVWFPLHGTENFILFNFPE